MFGETTRVLTALRRQLWEIQQINSKFTTKRTVWHMPGPDPSNRQLHDLEVLATILFPEPSTAIVPSAFVR